MEEPLTPFASAALETVPARMLNEVLYCERLCYLEWSQSEFVDNVFTVEGRHAHRRADEPTGTLPESSRGPTADSGTDTDSEPADSSSDSDTTSTSVTKKSKRSRSSSREDTDDNDDEEDEETERPYRARSIWLTSDRLGLTSKIDVVEVAEGAVTPIEYKRGTKPDLPEGAYLPERAQVCVQVLLLREHGYRCDRGEIYFAASKSRVPIEIDSALIETVHTAAARARELVRARQLPPPLVDSPKCPGCSLVSICLPDEITFLRGTEDTGGPVETGESDDPESEKLTVSGSTNAPRRLFPARPEALPLYVQEHGTYVGKKEERIEVRSNRGKTLAEVPLLKLSNVSLFANVQVSSSVIRELGARSIPICHFSSGGWFHSITHGLGSRNVELRMRQFDVARDPARALAFARRFITGKIRNQRTILRRNAKSDVTAALRDMRQAAASALRAENAASLLGIEGNAARLYFQSFATMIQDDVKVVAGTFDFQSRNRRPPRDPVNALLSFVYAILVKDLTVTLFAVGFDPYLGFFHTPHHGRPALALDLAEEFRPIIGDSTVLSLIKNKEVGSRDFLIRAGSCALTPDGRKTVLRAYERRMDALVTHPAFGYTISYRRILEVQARLLSRALFDEIPHYPTFETR